MLIHQLTVLTVLIAAIIGFIRGRPRYDVVALIALLAVIAAGILSPEEAFYSFGHPAVIIVASMFVISQGLVVSGVIDIVARKFVQLGNHPIIQLFLLTVIVGFVSAFVNNIGALALFLPIAIHMAKDHKMSPSKLLIPIAFASHLGGFLTLIGTPRNILVSSFRAQEGLGSFGMFDFALVGLPIAVVGVIFLAFISWRILPSRRSVESGEDIFKVKSYITEIKASQDSELIGITIKNIPDHIEKIFSVRALKRDDQYTDHFSGFETLKAGDILIVSAEPDVLTDIVEGNDFELAQSKAKEQGITSEEEQGDIEAVVMPQSDLVGRSWSDIPFRMRYGVNLLAVAREGERLSTSIEEIIFKPSDVILLQGRKESINDSLLALGCFPLADRGLSLGRSRHIFLSLAIFGVAIALTTFSVVPVHIALLSAALALILTNIMSVKQAYQSINWPILILIGSMLAFSEAFINSGSDRVIGDSIIGISDAVNPLVVLAVVLIVTMLLSDFVSTTIAAVLMSPVAIYTATSIGVSIDPFLMAVAIGSASAFLTPIGHESNTLVLGPGGYKFFDYIKVGLPLDVIIIIISLILIPIFWPF